ncbi:Bax inhibitor-1/YccA family protein [Priestia filamentosa]|uniref:Bax inhibitor-1/YccA family protein n=1 Tax=Priestia filamentosa TaxID=1402861 RepID=UPI001FB260AF|nr:Bax inhibitor-1/YccA family protein [Priestia filamentosa]MED3727837.1 Bax inhibitor-1/YccA family protein [Priestia filamentosa]UOE60289.1 Bax inhibitor-1/YccA family protein [Priestia filamentosa]
MLKDVSVQERPLFQKVLSTFVLTLLIATVGLYIGQFVPAALMLPLAVAEVVMLIAAFWLRRKSRVGYAFVYAFAAISGITTYPIVSYYVSMSGANVVLQAFGSTFGIFLVMAVIGSKMKKDLSFLSSFLLVAVLSMIFVSLFGLFTGGLTSGSLMALSVIGTIVFSLYVLYDFNQMKRMQITQADVPLLALSLYLDFINLFINLLRFFGILGSDD